MAHRIAAKPQARIAVKPPPLPFDERRWPVVVASLGLAPQQARVVELVVRGLRDKQIAETMAIGVPTVRTYMARVFDRAGVEDRVELILRVVALANGVANSAGTPG